MRAWISGRRWPARDLADAVRSGRIPDLQVLRGYDDDDVVAALTAVRGIGRWTAEMQLIFLLDRPDVFPVADVGIRRGFERVLGLDVKATSAQMVERSQDWAPYRSVASWYLWRAVDQTGQSVPGLTWGALLVPGRAPQVRRVRPSLVP